MRHGLTRSSSFSVSSRPFCSVLKYEYHLETGVDEEHSTLSDSFIDSYRLCSSWPLDSVERSSLEPSKSSIT
jgi:hypothetical protein